MSVVAHLLRLLRATGQLKRCTLGVEDRDILRIRRHRAMIADGTFVSALLTCLLIPQLGRIGWTVRIVGDRPRAALGPDLCALRLPHLLWIT